MVQIYHVNLDLTHTYVVVYFKLHKKHNYISLIINKKGSKN